jgi:oxygen-independent coproporphyrinogen-3 oxidase
LFSALADLGALLPELIGTVELHPELFAEPARSDELLDVLASRGIKRVSLGFQSQDEDLLHGTNRRHGAAFLADAVALLRRRGFLLNIDLMYGLPGLTPRSWLSSIQTVLGMRPDSISAYFTFVDPGTRLWRAVRSGRAQLPAHRDVQLQHIATQLAFESAGYTELPNDFYSVPSGDPTEFRQDSLPSEANSLALGAGAYGYYPGVQYFNAFSFRDYSQAVRSGRSPIWRAAVLSQQEQLCRDIMFSFKNSPSLDMELFRARYGSSPLDIFPTIFARLFDLGLVEHDTARVRLTPKGRLVVEEIACLFEPPDHSDTQPRHRPGDQLLRKHNFAPTYTYSASNAQR